MGTHWEHTPHSKGARPRLLAFSLAPVVGHYLGAPDTMAMHEVQYLFVDRYVAPPEYRDLYQEHLILLAPPYHFYSSRRNEFRGSAAARAPTRNKDADWPGEGGRATGTAAKESDTDTDGQRGGIKTGGIVSLDAQVDIDRVDQDTWQTWLRLLATCPHTTLRLRQARNPHARALLQATLAASARAANISRERLQVLPKVSPKAAHLERLAVGSDLFLDTDFYSAHSTGLDALWAGVPILTFPRQTFASRAPCSFLEALGQAHLIARNREEYEGIARKLIDSPRALSRWRQRLWRSRLAGVEAEARSREALHAAGGRARGLFNESRMVASFHVSLKLMWEIAAAFDARKPMHILVSEGD